VKNHVHPREGEETCPKNTDGKCKDEGCIFGLGVTRTMGWGGKRGRNRKNRRERNLEETKTPGGGGGNQSWKKKSF